MTIVFNLLIFNTWIIREAIYTRNCKYVEGNVRQRIRRQVKRAETASWSSNQKTIPPPPPEINRYILSNQMLYRDIRSIPPLSLPCSFIPLVLHLQKEGLLSISSYPSNKSERFQRQFHAGYNKIKIKF